MLNRFTTAAAIAAVAVALAAPALAQQTYLLTDIGPKPNPIGPQLVINASGQILGTDQVNGPWVWKPSSANATTGTFSYLPVPSGTAGFSVEGINNLGQIVGSRTYASGTTTTKIKGKTQTVVVYTTVAAEWLSDGTEVDLPAG